MPTVGGGGGGVGAGTRIIHDEGGGGGSDVLFWVENLHARYFFGSFQFYHCFKFQVVRLEKSHF